MILINRTTFPNQILILKLQNTKTNKKKQKYFRYERKYMYALRHISPIICTFGHFGANIGLWRLIWWPVGCGAWLLLRQSFYLLLQWMGKIMHCFLKNNTGLQLFVPIVLKKIASGFNVAFECFVWYDAILSAWWTWVLKHRDHQVLQWQPFALSVDGDNCL